MHAHSDSDSDSDSSSRTVNVVVVELTVISVIAVLMSMDSVNVYSEECLFRTHPTTPASRAASTTRPRKFTPVTYARTQQLTLGGHPQNQRPVARLMNT